MSQSEHLSRYERIWAVIECAGWTGSETIDELVEALVASQTDDAIQHLEDKLWGTTE